MDSDYLLLDVWLVRDVVVVVFVGDVVVDGRKERSRDETCMKRHEEDLFEAS